MRSSSEESPSYNERLFAGGIRTYFHLARFVWVRDQIRRFAIKPDVVLELGCYDGRLLEFISPRRYVGLDANWEGGLDLARVKYAGIHHYEFRLTERPADMKLEGESFDLAVSLETLEHVPAEMVDGYLCEIARHLNGHLIVTVPNETGLVFLGKWLVKTVFRLNPEPYSPMELCNALLGRTERIRRKEHKGFNFRDMIQEIERHFEVLDVEGFPLRWLPASLCFSIGITARTRRALVGDGYANGTARSDPPNP